MSDPNAVSDPNNSPSGVIDDQNSQQTVSHETHRRLLAQLKKNQEALAALKSEKENQALELQKAEGKKDEVIQALDKKVRDLEQQSFGLVQNFTKKTILGEVTKEALKRGLQPEKLDKFKKLTQDNFLKDSGIQVDAESFSIQNREIFDKIMEEQVNDNQDWFTKQVTPPRDINPDNSGGMTVVPEKRLEDKSIEELAEML